MSREKFEKFLEKIDDKKENLLELLIVAQDEIGKFSDENIEYLSEKLEVSKEELEETVEFFPYLKTGKEIVDIEVCDGTSCFVAGSEFVYHRFYELLKPDENGLCENKKFRLKKCGCHDKCEYGSYVYAGEKSFNHVTEEDCEEIIKEIGE